MITTLTGPNGYLLRSQLRTLTDIFLKSYGNFGLEKIHAAEVDYRQLLESVQALPFLAEKRMVVIDSPASNKQLVEKIEEFIAAINEQTDVILVEPKFDKRSVLYKYLKRKTEFKEQTELSDNEMVKWIIAETKHHGGQINSNSAQYLLSRVGNDQMRLSNEILKLVSYTSEITKDSIDLLTAKTPQSTIFELLDAAFAGNRKRVLQLYEEQRKLKVEPQAILALLAWQLHILAVIKSAGDKSASEIASLSKINPYVLTKSSDLIRNINLDQLKQLVQQTLAIDIALKSQPINADQAVKTLLFTIPAK